MSKQYRIAIVGIGAIAGMHAAAIETLDNAVVVAGSCRGEKKGHDFAAKHDCRWFADYEKMLDETKPDVVTICTPSGAHLEPTQAAAARGIHVLCEKPLEITTARVDQMIDVCDKAGVKLGGIFPQRFNPVTRAIFDAAKTQRFGSLAAISGYIPWWRPDDYYAPERWQGTLALDGGGALMNQGIHMVDAVQWIAGATMPELNAKQNPVVDVFAYTAKRGHDPSLIEVEDTAVVCLHFANGALGQFLAATSFYPGSFRRLQIAGRDGLAEVEEDLLDHWQFRQPMDHDDAIRQQFSKQADSHGGAGDPMAFAPDNHIRNIQSFLEAIDKNETPTVDGHEARKAVEIIEAIYESARDRKPVDIGG